jgi:hypothetical protein
MSRYTDFESTYGPLMDYDKRHRRETFARTRPHNLLISAYS